MLTMTELHALYAALVADLSARRITGPAYSDSIKALEQKATEAGLPFIASPEFAANDDAPPRLVTLDELDAEDSDPFMLDLDDDEDSDAWFKPDAS